MVILVSWKFKNPGERSDWSVDSVAVGKCVIWLAVKTCAEIGYANNLKHDYRKDAFSMTSSLSFTLSLCFLQCKLRGLYIHQVVASFWVTEIREWEIESKYTRIREAQRAHAPRVSRIFRVSRNKTVVKRLHMWEQYCGTTSWSEVVRIKLSHKSWKQAHKLVSPYIYILWRQTEDGCVISTFKLTYMHTSECINKLTIHTLFAGREGPYWKKLCQRYWVPPEVYDLGRFWKPKPVNNILIFFWE